MTVPVPTVPVPTVPGIDERSGGETGWLTTVLRPAGTLTGAGGQRFASALRAASASSGVVMVDLRAVGPLPRPVRRALADADERLTLAGGALLVVDRDEVGLELPAPRTTGHLLDTDS